MKLLVIGAGNIGLVTAVCLASKGHRVYCTDTDHKKIELLKNAQTSIYEPKLQELLQENLTSAQVSFHTELDEVINKSDIVIIAVGTPNLKTGHVNITALDSIIEDISKKSQTCKTIIIKSTAPPGTNKKYSNQYLNHIFVSVPEFLREGNAIDDCFNPERVIVGSDYKETKSTIHEIYSVFNISPEKFIFMDSTSAEMTKYAANVFLAARISLMNEFSLLCDHSGANIQSVQKGIGLDPRIGKDFLNSGLGYGGSCFPKDINALIQYAKDLGEELHITKSIKKVNDFQIERFVDKILVQFRDAKNTTLCIWGLAFKPNTNDTRDASALKLIDILITHHFKLNLYDPKVFELTSPLLRGRDNVRLFKDQYEAVKDTNALVIATEWNEFQDCDLQKVRSLLKSPIIFDGRNIFEVNSMKKAGFNYQSIGRPS
jgi:UDPglucose 6-dehydrogenase